MYESVKHNPDLEDLTFLLGHVRGQRIRHARRDGPRNSRQNIGHQFRLWWKVLAYPPTHHVTIRDGKALTP